MRAKNIEVIKLRSNPSLDCTQIVYNLAFSPGVKHLDLTGSCTTISNTSALVEALFKLLKISRSIETLLLGGTAIAKNLSLDFCKAVGESPSIKHINFDGPMVAGQVTSSFSYANLMKAVAMNAYKNGSLERLSLKRLLGNLNLSAFFQCLYISDKDHELWYGDQQEANKMEKEQLERKLYCNLKTLDIGQGKHSKLGFKLKPYQMQKDPKWPEAIKFFGNNKSLQVLQVPKCSVTDNSELWASMLGQNPTGPCNLQVLNLSDNGIGISAAKSLASAFEFNNSIQYLDLSNNPLQVYGTVLFCKSLQNNKTLKGLNLFKNLIDVDGARAVRDFLKSNKTLEFLDLGHNRIRAKGLEAIAQGIVESEDSKLKTLGIRMNFLTDDALKHFFDETVFAGKGKLENIYIKFNNIT